MIKLCKKRRIKIFKMKRKIKTLIKEKQTLEKENIEFIARLSKIIVDEINKHGL